MSIIWIALIVTVVALATSIVIFPYALRFAVRHGIVDAPNSRKLQRKPVPVFGGLVVFLGILVGVALLSLFMFSPTMLWALLVMAIMMSIGIWDDMKDIPAWFRFLIEIALISGFITITGFYIDDLHGLWGIHALSPWVGIPLSVIAGVGTINAINMIDGVDGYSSGYGMMSCTCFIIAFWSVWNPVIICMTLIVAGALFPFFLHNVFGSKSRMFIGDGGTLMLGTLMVVLSLYSMSSLSDVKVLEEKGICILAFFLAVGCIPIFDTLRVMTLRILRGTSPFKPDKTHLHHLFIDMGFSHLGAALSILSINALVVLAWLVSWQLGASLDVQMYVVLALGLLVTFGFYKFMKVQQNGGPLDNEGYPQGSTVWHTMCKLGSMTHREDRWFWRTMRNTIDGPLFFWGGGKIV